MKEFIVGWRIDLTWLWAKKKSAWVSPDGWLQYCLWAASLYLTAQEQAELNQGFLALVLKKVWGMHDFMPETITSAMRSAQIEGYLNLPRWYLMKTSVMSKYTMLMKQQSKIRDCEPVHENYISWLK